MEKNLGKIAITNGGTYSASTTYDKLTRVRYNGATYVSKQQTKGNTPAENSAYWQLEVKDMVVITKDDTTPPSDHSVLWVHV